MRFFRSGGSLEPDANSEAWKQLQQQSNLNATSDAGYSQAQQQQQPAQPEEHSTTLERPRKPQEEVVNTAVATEQPVEQAVAEAEEKAEEIAAAAENPEKYAQLQETRQPVAEAEDTRQTSSETETSPKEDDNSDDDSDDTFVSRHHLVLSSITDGVAHLLTQDYQTVSMPEWMLPDGVRQAGSIITCGTCHNHEQEATRRQTSLALQDKIAALLPKPATAV
jgi:hypothetical protein